MKGKLVTMAVSFLLCIGMVGAGFASWIITAKTEVTGQGEVKVDTVVDKRIKVTSVDAGGVDVIFGAPKDAIDDAWLLNDNLDNEDLTSSVTLNLDEANLVQLKAAGVNKLTFSATISVSADDLSAYNTAKTKNYIVEPTTIASVEIDLSSATVTEDEETGTKTINVAKTATLTCDFGWGSYFNLWTDKNENGDVDAGENNPVNPYVYFNSLWEDGSDVDELPAEYADKTVGDMAYDVLSAIQAIGGVKITITVTGVVS